VPAVELFVARAVAPDPGFRPDARSVAMIQAICALDESLDERFAACSRCASATSRRYAPWLLEGTRVSSEKIPPALHSAETQIMQSIVVSAIIPEGLVVDARRAAAVSRTRFLVERRSFERTGRSGPADHPDAVVIGPPVYRTGPD
jgi:hypothetical protein